MDREKKSPTASANLLLSMFNRLNKVPFGKKIFSRLVCVKAPYFGTIKPDFVDLRPGYCEITMKNRRCVTAIHFWMKKTTCCEPSESG